MKQIALIKAVKDGNKITIDNEGEIRDILTIIGVALYDIETKLPEDKKSDFRLKVLQALEAPRIKFKGDIINENC